MGEPGLTRSLPRRNDTGRRVLAV